MKKINILKKCLCGAISGMLIMQCSVASAKVKINIPAVTGFSLAGALAVVCASLGLSNRKSLNEKDSKIGDLEKLLESQKEINNKCKEEFEKNEEKLKDLLGTSQFQKEEIEKERNKMAKECHCKYWAMFYSDEYCREHHNYQFGVKYWYANEITKEIENLFTEVGTGKRDNYEFFRYVKDTMFSCTDPGTLISSIGERIMEISSSDESENWKRSKIQSECLDENHINQIRDAIYNYYNHDGSGSELRDIERLYISFADNGFGLFRDISRAYR